MISLLSVLLQIVAVIALADFVAGLVHWAEDRYGTADTPIVGPLVIRPNIVHHHVPRYFTRLGWWRSSWELVLLSATGLYGAWRFGCLTWHVWLFALASVNANQIHKWAHRTRAENGPIVSALQDIRLLQTPRHHGLHHTDPKNTFYCPITNFVNPVLERTKFWPRAEWLVWQTTGVRPRQDTAVRGQGPAPAWLAAYREKAAARIAVGGALRPDSASSATPATTSPLSVPRTSHDCSVCPRAATCPRNPANHLAA